MGRRKLKQQHDNTVAFSGDGTGMKHQGRSGVDQGWRCGRPFKSEWRGDKTLTDLAPDLTTLDFYGGTGSGMFGTQTPVDLAHVSKVCPGLTA